MKKPLEKLVSMSNKPLISVVMPAYNSERFVSRAIQSILDQSIDNFEFVIVEDGSKDKTLEIIKRFKDERIKVIENKENFGLARSLNIGVRASNGDYIARMDADDIAEPDRLEKQLKFLEANPKVGIVGSSMLEIDTNERPITLLRKPSSHIEIKWSSLFSTPMYHSTIFARSNILIDNPYDENLSNSEDYELWSRILFKTDIHLANIDKPLLKYRVYPESFTRTLNLDKRVLSAHNTIKNIDHYISLSQDEEELIIRLKQERRLGIKSLVRIILIYMRSARAFILKEKVGPSKWFPIYKRVLKTTWFALKYYVKQI